MTINVFPSIISGNLEAPPSKSYMLRAAVLSLLSENKTIIHNASHCDDALTVLNILKDFGCEIKHENQSVHINAQRIEPPASICCGESGLALRLITPIAAIWGNEIRLTAKGSLQKRPSEFMKPTLQQLGVEFVSHKGLPPITIKKQLHAGTAITNGSESSQFLTGLLTALPMLKEESVLKVKNLKSKPYIDMTLEIIKDFGGQIHNRDYETFIIPGAQKYSAKEYSVEGDWSAAAALLTAGAIAGNIQVAGLKPNSRQADILIQDAIKQSGALIAWNELGVSVSKARKLLPFTINAENSPDLFPALCALAVNCEGVSVIHGAHRLKYKESNRGEVLKNEFAKIGAKVELKDNDMIVTGSRVEGGTAHAHNDHRIAMALSLAALNAKNKVKITGAECVKKSYPNYFEDMQLLGLKVQKE